MRRRDQIVRLVVLLGLATLLVGCTSGGDDDGFVVVCDGCDSVELWETSLATRVVGEVEPGASGATTDSAWNALVGSTYYYVVIGDQEGWVSEDYLDFQ